LPSNDSGQSTRISLQDSEHIFDEDPTARTGRMVRPIATVPVPGNS
jgi:hypothetical protein